MSTALAALLALALGEAADPPIPARRARAVTRGELIRPGDYPAESLANGEEGTVGFTITVGTSGRITDCRITRSSGHARLDETTCRVLTERVRFKPAKDAAGKPTTDWIAREMTWKLPQAQ